MEKIFGKAIFQLNTFAKFTVAVAILSATIISCNKDDNSYSTVPPVTNPQATVVSASGDSLGIVSKLVQFRSLLGDTLNTTPNKTTGRREVNWDGVPAAFTNQNNFPSNFFNSTVATDPAGRKRGLELTNTGTSFRVDSTDFSEIDASYANQFEAFSRKRLFTYMGSIVTQMIFKVPGTSVNAFVKGFGVIFSDVDDANSTTVEFFNGSKSLGIYKVQPKSGQAGFSFLGVYFESEKITGVKIISGNGLLGAGIKDVSDGGAKDLVVMDDFLYNEPIAQQ